jgi:parallel beta-helix repeat protein
VAVQVSANGGSTWTEIARYAGAGTDSALKTASFNILYYAAANTQVRFATSAALGTSDILYVDNVKIEYALSPATFTVNNTGDGADASLADGICQTSTTGQCTFRAAIQQANASTGKNIINFNISGAGPHNIQPTSALPEINDPVIVDGSSEPDFVTNGNKPIIVIAGTNLGWVDGLVLNAGADGSVIRGLVIRDWGAAGIWIAPGSDNNLIVGNYIGRLTTSGTDSGYGTQNDAEGIYIEGSYNIIGGLTAAERNVISGNGNAGIYLQGASGNTIIGNYIGTDATGLVDLGNEERGVWLESGSNNNTIGGTSTAARNVIAGNDISGVLIADGASPGVNASGNVVQGNYIGVGADGTTALGNLQHGVHIATGADNNLIGGTAAGAGNIIANSQWRGVNVQTSNSTGITIQGNLIYSNGLTGIDLEDNGVTTNNGTKSSSQANYGMDFPVITSASLSGCGLTVAGYVGSAANQSTFANVRVEFFKSDGDGSGYGEGQTFLGYTTTDSSGNFSFNGSLTVSGLGAGGFLTATATDSNGNTSEFGPNFQLTNVGGTCAISRYVDSTAANQLNLTGSGVTVAVIDSGITTNHPDLMSGSNSRVIASTKFGLNLTTEDVYGHGTHVAGIIAGNGTASNGLYRGMAPGASLVNIKVSDAFGMTYESDVVDALQWIYNNKDTYNIRVVNISMNSTVAQSYQTSPLCAAVEILWFNGIVVVVSAGNNGNGSDPVTIYPPANDPFVITVGATEEFGTVLIEDDALAVFSAYGTTESGFAKPDIVAPGRNIIAPLGGLLNTAFQQHPLHRVNDYYFRMSGTSMAAPVVSGAVALLLQDEPGLNPDQVKYRLMATANRNWANYNASKAGAGQLDIYAAVYGSSTESANTGILVSQMLTTGSDPITWGSVGWNSVGWNSVGWNSVGWNSVGWNSVGWNSVGWNTSTWDD